MNHQKRGCGWKWGSAHALGILALLVASVGAGCSEADTRLCAAYACFNSASLTGRTVVAAQTAEVAAHFCFDADCRDGTILLAPLDGSTPCARWEGGTVVCLNSTRACGVYEITATWDHQFAEKPAEGSTYTIALTDSASGALLLEETSAATYTDGPNLDGCHPNCWRAGPIAIGDPSASNAAGGGGMGEGGAAEGGAPGCP